MKKNNAMKIAALIVTFILACPNFSWAQTVESEILNNIYLHTKNAEPEKAKNFMTSGSYDLYDRLYGYNLSSFLPEKPQAVSQRIEGEFTHVQFVYLTVSNKHGIIAAFLQDKAAQKLDLAETFRMAFREKWPDVPRAMKKMSN